MKVDIAVVIALVSVGWSAGLFVGMLFSKFVSKKECEVKCQKIWDRIDCITDGLTGGKITFELRQLKSES
jgi:hypothetical protein